MPGRPKVRISTVQRFGLRQTVDAMVGLYFGPFIIVDLKLAIYCNTSGYNVRMYNTEELFYDQKRKKQLSW